MSDENDLAIVRELWVAICWYPDLSLPCWQGLLVRYIAHNEQEAIEWCDRNPGHAAMTASLANIVLEQTHRPTFRRIESSQIANN